MPLAALAMLALSACENSTHLAEADDSTGSIASTSPSPHPTSPPTTTESTTTAAPTSARPTTPRPSSPTSAKPPATPTHAPPSASGSSSSPLGLGTFHVLGKDFRVSVTAVDLNADRELEEANSFNDPPDGRYILAELNVVYLGHDEGNPWIDLTTKFVGGDARQYDSNACGAVVAHPGVFVPTLERGGRARYQVCWDVPVTAIARSKIFVEQTFVFEGQRVYWKSR